MQLLLQLQVRIYKEQKCKEAQHVLRQKPCLIPTEGSFELKEGTHRVVCAMSTGFIEARRCKAERSLVEERLETAVARIYMGQSQED